ncbi:hypothetical protein ACFPM3_01110 [Streptomyces coeruleoprunus]|uniref:Uncharacterized protein n=2 Tax=Streptomyces coeruleoprunus TaxID=285563 RepID=A0ABV9X8G6_9ACTN
MAGGLLLALLSHTATIEMETFPGLRENRGPMVVWICGIAVLSAVAGYALQGWRSRGALVMVLLVGVVVALRLYTIAPALHCWSYDSVGRHDGAYHCVNRWE